MATIREIVFDCLDPAALARFWAAALDGYQVRPCDDETDPSVAVDGPGPTLFFQKVAEPKTARNRVHLDIEAARPRDEVERLLALGASLRRERGDLTVLLDPEGNEFCVVELR